MMIFSPFQNAERHKSAANFVDHHGLLMPALFGDAAAEYRHVREQAGLFDRGDRGLLLVTGRDRKPWLHNLITNAVKTLEDGRGCYAFAADVRGRVQFDLNALARPDALWLDIDFATVEPARKHLDRMLITEDARMKNASADFARLGVAGPRAAEIAQCLGVPDLNTMPTLASAAVPTAALPRGLVAAAPELVLFRHDFAGLPGFEMFVPSEQAAAWWDGLLSDENFQSLGLRPAGLETLHALRIEAGIPWFPEDIDDKTLPPETGQVARGISYHKGCYLGQEVLERMRSHGSLARRLMRLTIENGDSLKPPAALLQSGTEAGRLTSLVKHPAEPHWIGLGYLKTKIQDFTNLVVGEPPRAVRILGPVAD